MPLGQLKENLTKTAKISGDVVAGFYANGIESSKKPYITAKVPKNWHAKDLCLTVVSDDGLYEGTQSYRVSSSGDGGWIDVPFLSNYGEFLSDTNQINIGIVFSENECNQKIDNFIPAVWNQIPEQQALDYTVLINTFSSDEAYLIINGSVQIKCSEAKSVKHIAFDHECIVNSKDVDLIKNEIELVRIKDSNILPPYIFFLTTPEG